MTDAPSAPGSERIAPDDALDTLSASVIRCVINLNERLRCLNALAALRAALAGGGDPDGLVQLRAAVSLGYLAGERDAYTHVRQAIDRGNPKMLVHRTAGVCIKTAEERMPAEAAKLGIPAETLRALLPGPGGR